jgi:phosphoribosylpyrophosphate synthetase
MITQVKQLKQMGARDIYYFGFHGMCVHDHFEKLVSSLPIEELIMTNSVFQANEVTFYKNSEQKDSNNFSR